MIFYLSLRGTNEGSDDAISHKHSKDCFALDTSCQGLAMTLRQRVINEIGLKVTKIKFGVSKGMLSQYGLQYTDFGHRTSDVGL
jgi:hypothetical protein